MRHLAARLVHSLCQAPWVAPVDVSYEYRKLLSVALLRRRLRLGQALHSKPPVSRGCASCCKVTQVVRANGDALRVCNFRVANGAARACHALRSRVTANRGENSDSAPHLAVPWVLDLALVAWLALLGRGVSLCDAAVLVCLRNVWRRHRPGSWRQRRRLGRRR